MITHEICGVPAAVRGGSGTRLAHTAVATAQAATHHIANFCNTFSLRARAHLTSATDQAAMTADTLEPSSIHTRWTHVGQGILAGGLALEAIGQSGNRTDAER